MTDVTIYTKQYCPYCTHAKKRLDYLGANYQEIDISDYPEKRREMLERSNGASTVPQIFFNNTLIGGNDDLEGMHESGELDQWFNEPVHEIKCNVTDKQLVCGCLQS